MTLLLRDHPGDRTLGYTLRGLRAAPEGFGGPYDGGWAADRVLLGSLLKAAREMLGDGRWVVTAEDRAAISTLGLDQAPAYDYPSAPAPGDPGHPSLLQRAHHVAHMSGVLRAAAARVPRDERGFRPPMEMVMTGATAVGMEAVATELDALWTGTELSCQDWEDEHVPDALRQAIASAEDNFDTLAAFFRELTASG
ncbi:hypothetical protein ACIQ7D_10405 [Streptomyces sp. NPDC096310]|uniref:hypothetical protein n=1 Tax=Streptomyces sp. NPDC096310 TaxID=3366082 RepID=UPI0037FCF681